MSIRKAILPTAISIAVIAALASCAPANTANTNSNNANEPANIEKNDNKNAVNANVTEPKASAHEIEKASFSFNYAEVGDGWSYELVRGENGKDTLYLTKIAYKKGDPNDFDLDHSTLEQIEGICEEGGVYNWPEKLGKPDVMYADRSEKHITIEYVDGTVRQFSTEDALPENGEDVISKIASVMQATVDID